MHPIFKHLSGILKLTAALKVNDSSISVCVFVLCVRVYFLFNACVSFNYFNHSYFSSDESKTNNSNGFPFLNKYAV